jgi:hypothetical protein
MAYITSTREAVNMIADTIKGSDLGIGYVGKFDEKRLPHYPAVVVSGAPREKEVHGTHTFAVTLRCFIYVYHASLSKSHANRSEEDMILVENIEALLEEDCTFGGRVVFGYVESEAPGVMQPRSEKSEIVVSTRMTWMAGSQARF